MGLSSKHVSGDHQAGSGGGFEWGSLQSGAAEQSKPPSTRRQQAEPLKCPRCNSANTKFCYYNNYNKSQPRHFCKSCKRHWTKGGTLRNVPVGGGRKNKRPKISKPATTTNTAAAPRQQDFPDFDTGAQKSVPNFIYQALLHETTKGFNNTTNSGGLSDNNPTSEFHFSSLLNTSTFDMNVSLNPTCYHPFDHYAGNLEESTITTVNIPISSSSGPWDSTSTLDLPNYWNWSDIDVLNSADLNISWDDNDDSNADQVKPQNKFHD